MKALLVISSVLTAVSSQTNIQNLPGLDAWRSALEAHAAAEGRLSGITPVIPAHPFQGGRPNTPRVPQGGRVPGLSQWQVHQMSVLQAERRLENQNAALEQRASTRVASPAPSFSAARSDTQAFPERLPLANKGAQDFRSSLTQYIDEIQEERRNEEGTETKPRTRTKRPREQTNRQKPQTFLDKLLDTYGTPPKEQGSTKPTQVPKRKEDEESSKSLTEILGLKKNRKKSKGKTAGRRQNKRRPNKKKSKSKATKSAENVLIIQQFLEDRNPQKRTTTAKPEIADILGSVETDDLLTSLLAAFSGGEKKTNNKDPAKLNKEIQQFLVLLEQVEADIDNEVQPSRKSKNKGRRVETRKGDEESDRRNSGVQASGFLQNELRLAAEESEELNKEMELLMEELEAEKQKELKFANETFEIINNRINSGIGIDEIKKDREFVDSVFQRFAVLGHPLREEDISINALKEAMQTVTENVLRAAEESKRIAKQLGEQIKGSKGSRRTPRRRGRKGRKLHFFKDMENIRTNLKTALKTVQF